MVLNIFAVLSGIVSLYFFQKDLPVLAVPFLVLMLSRLFVLRQPFKDRISLADWERTSNVSLSFDINLQEVLDHPSLDPLFDQLKSANRIKQLNKETWRAVLLGNYKRKYDTSADLRSVKFQIKNNLVLKEGTTDLANTVHDHIFIPYEFRTPLAEEPLWEVVENGISVRLLMVNGFIKVQLGCFTKEFTPKIYRQTFPVVYQTWVTVTSFPLMYFAQHNIPPAQLNLYAPATESWKRAEYTGSNERMKDWQELKNDLKLYVEMHKHPQRLDTPQRQALLEILAKKRKPFMEEQGFEHVFGKEGASIMYKNKYLYLTVFDRRRDTTTDQFFTDYNDETDSLPG